MRLSLDKEIQMIKLLFSQIKSMFLWDYFDINTRSCVTYILAQFHSEIGIHLTQERIKSYKETWI